MMSAMMGSGAWGGAMGAGSWGSPSASSSQYGSWQNSTSWSSGPYEKSEKQKEREKKQKEQEEAERRWAAKHKGPMPPVDWLPIAATSSIVQQGYPLIAPAMEFDKEKEIFSDAHKILQDFFIEGESYPLIKDVVDIDHDYDCTAYPEVHQAWKLAGNEENSCTVAKCRSANQWGVGFGGKVNATRAAKLALALAMITTAEPNTVARVTSDYPNFFQLVIAAQKTHPASLAAQQAQE